VLINNERKLLVGLLMIGEKEEENGKEILHDRLARNI